MTASPQWTIDPDRALPAESGTRGIGREIHAEVEALPIVSMHGHVEAHDGTVHDR